jgi:hypothetical protein
VNGTRLALRIVRNYKSELRIEAGLSSGTNPKSGAIMRTILLMILVAVFLLNISAQEIPEGKKVDQKTEPNDEHFPTGRELIATRKIVKSFNENLNLSFDVRAALKGISANDWAERTTSEVFKGEENLIEGIAVSDFIKSNTAENLYLAYGKFLYVYALHHFMLVENHEKNVCVPDEVRILIDRNPLISSVIGESSHDSANITSLAQYADLVKNLNEAGTIYEYYLRRLISENPEQFAKTLAKMEKDSVKVRTEVEVLSEPKFGLPVNTRVITARAYLSNLIIAETVNGFQVVGVMIDFGD